MESVRTLTKAQENELLINFNKVIEKIAAKENINVTLFFSKKAQKDFIRKVLIQGIENAFEGVTEWRKKLLHEDVVYLMK